VSITETLAAALATDLATVTALAEIGREPKRVDEALAPSAFIVSAQGSADLESLSNREGESYQTFTVQTMVRGATPNADMNNLFDSIRNAVERDGGALMVLPTVVTVSVTRWSSVFTESSIHEGVYIRELDVTVRYVYTRGGA
jgi:hypothetical protein